METEIKIEVSDLAPVRERLRELGATDEGAVEERNVYFDREGALRERWESLRLRQDRRARLTWKGPSRFQGGVLSRPEVEVEVSSFDDTAEILRRLGYGVAEELVKRRETWRLDAVVVALDTLDFGRFVELEGEADRARRVARQLGLDPADGLPWSYRLLRKKRRGSDAPGRGDGAHSDAIVGPAKTDSEASTEGTNPA
jgi:adenylate cyclase class 2